jgi:4'-phosphopantetheinyl transferase
MSKYLWDHIFSLAKYKLPMIRWLIQSVVDHPDLSAGRPSAGLLTSAELEQFHGLLSPQRRRDWLLGRWTAKRLIQRHVGATHGFCPALDSFAIEQEASGAPYVASQHPALQIPEKPHPSPPQIGEGAVFSSRRHCSLPHPGSGSRLRERIGCVALPFALSISHSHGYAFCALCADGAGQARLGVDIELVERRAEDFAQEFFTASEQANIGVGVSPVGTHSGLVMPTFEHDLLTTATWSGKEAVLKATHLGLRIDPRSVQCLPRPNRPRHWTPLQIQAEEMGPLRAWWRVVDNRLRPGTSFVLVIAAYRASL